jgi:hypothetical protein
MKKRKATTRRNLTEGEWETVLTGDVDRMTDAILIAFITIVLRDAPNNRKKELYRELWTALCPIAVKFEPEPEAK